MQGRVAARSTGDSRGVTDSDAAEGMQDFREADEAW